MVTPTSIGLRRDCGTTNPRCPSITYHYAPIHPENLRRFSIERTRRERFKNGKGCRSTQRVTDGAYSAEVDGSASDATLTLANSIDLSDYSSAALTFDWLIESGFDGGEYLSLDVSSNGGGSWQNDVRRLNGNVEAENTWHSASRIRPSTTA